MYFSLFLFYLFIYLLSVYFLQGGKMENNYPKLKCRVVKWKKNTLSSRARAPERVMVTYVTPPPLLLLDSLTLICAKCASFFKNLQQTRKFSLIKFLIVFVHIFVLDSSVFFVQAYIQNKEQLQVAYMYAVTSFTVAQLQNICLCFVTHVIQYSRLAQWPWNVHGFHFSVAF